MDKAFSDLQRAIILFGCAIGLFAFSTWVQLVGLIGGSLEDAIRIPSMILLIFGTIYWPFFIRRKLKEKKPNGST